MKNKTELEKIGQNKIFFLEIKPKAVKDLKRIPKNQVIKILEKPYEFSVLFNMMKEIGNYN